MRGQQNLWQHQQQRPSPPQWPLVEKSEKEVDNNKWGFDKEEIDKVFATLQTPSRPPTRQATILPAGQVELTEEDLQGLVRIQQREADGRARNFTYSSELHPAVVGHNRSEQKQTQRLLKQWYYEQRYQTEKVSNAQRETYKKLCLLHVDRRRQARELMNYKREEARAQVERERDRQRRGKELALLEKQLQKLREEMVLERSSSPLIQLKLPSLRRLKRKTAAGVEAAVVGVAAATEEADTRDAAASSFKKEAAPLEAKASQNLVQQTFSTKQDASMNVEVVTLTAKVVEVDRRGVWAAGQGSSEMVVLERSRSKSFIRESTGLKTTESRPPAVQTSPAQAAVASTKTGTLVEAEEPPQHHPLLAMPLVLQPLTPPAERKVAKTQVEKNRERAKRKEEASRQLLLEPYRQYCCTKSGVIEPVEFLSPKFPTTEPSNRPLYEHHKRLEHEKASYYSSMKRLGQYTAELLNESIRLPTAFEQPKSKLDGSGPPKELRLGPSDWMKVFLRTNAPEDVEAGSFEAMKYVEYLRPEAPNTDREFEFEKIFEN